MTVLLIDIERSLIVGMFIYCIFIKLFAKKYFKFIEKRTNVTYDKTSNMWLGHPLKGKDGDVYVYLFSIPVLIISLLIGNYLSKYIQLSWTMITIIMFVVGIYVIYYVFKNDNY